MARDSGAFRGGNEAKLMNQPITAMARFGSEKAAFSVAWAGRHISWTKSDL
jgi:hypothetical protein